MVRLSKRVNDLWTGSINVRVADTRLTTKVDVVHRRRFTGFNIYTVSPNLVMCLAVFMVFSIPRSKFHSFVCLGLHARWAIYTLV